MERGPHKLLLIEPPFYRLHKETYSLDRYPLALGYLAGAAMKDTNWRVQTYCAEFSPVAEPMTVSYLTGEGFDSYLKCLGEPTGPVWQEVKSAIASYQPTVVGITSKSQNFASARIVAGLAKAVNPNVIVVLGGPHVSMVGAKALDCPDIDICSRGEGEGTLVELLQAIECGRELDGVNGLIFRKDGRIVETGPRSFIENLDELPFPHLTAPQVLKDYDKYPLGAFRYIFGTRGCPYNCSFCASRNIWSRKTRFRPVDSIVAEINSLRSLGLWSVHFADDTFGISQQFLAELCGAIKTRCRGVRWSCEIHVKLAGEQNIAMMKSAGCHLIQLGVESGNDEMLRKIRKNITIEEALAAARIIKRHGIALEAYFMVGFPEETEATLLDTLDAMEKIHCNILVFSIFTPYPGSEMFDLCKEKGLVDDSFDVSLYNHQSRANYFCDNISRGRFAELVGQVEAMVDRKNAANHRRQMFNIRRKWWRIRELGLRESLKQGIRMILGG